ncbi:MAG: hypothetical protein GY835_05095 [bacterium]|nr:hypothetical protein [bacterium]
MNKLTDLLDYIRKIPVPFLVAITLVLAMILFVPQKVAETLAVDGFRDNYRIFLGPSLILFLAFSAARVFSHFANNLKRKDNTRKRDLSLYYLTPEEKGYLVQYMLFKKNTIHVGLDDGIMAGLALKHITYRASNIGDLLNGFAFNLQSWAREYLEEHPELLDGYAGKPLTPQQKLYR